MPNLKCPHCGGFKTSSVRGLAFAVGVVFCIFIITAPLGILCFVLAATAGGKKMYCYQCHAKFEKEV